MWNKCIINQPALCSRTVGCSMRCSSLLSLFNRVSCVSISLWKRLNMNSAAALRRSNTTTLTRFASCCCSKTVDISSPTDVRCSFIFSLKDSIWHVFIFCHWRSHWGFCYTMTKTSNGTTSGRVKVFCTCALGGRYNVAFAPWWRRGITVTEDKKERNIWMDGLLFVEFTIKDTCNRYRLIDWLKNLLKDYRGSGRPTVSWQYRFAGTKSTKRHYSK